MKKTGTSLLIVTVLALLGQSGQAAMEGMVSYWRLDEPAGYTVCDSVGDNHGTIYSDPQRVAGIVGGAMRFDGVDDYVEVPDDSSLDFGTADFSIAVWVNFDTVPSAFGHALVIKRQQGSVYPGYSLFSILDGQLQGQLDFGWPLGPWHEHTTTSAPLTAGAWYHVVWAVDRARSESYFYVNGEAIGYARICL